MANTLNSDLKAAGLNQEDLVAFLENTRDVVNELQADHATYKAVVDEMAADHATFRTVVADLKTLLNNLRSFIIADRVVAGDPGLAIDTNFDVQTGNPLVVQISEVMVSVAATTSCDTGTSATFAAAKWGIFLVSVDAAGALTATWDDNSQAGFDSEALAIAALPATPAGEVALGYVTVQAHASNTFTAGTDALQGGTGGNPSPDTNYYDYADTDLAALITAAVSTSAPAALSNSAPAALTNSTALKLTAG